MYEKHFGLKTRPFHSSHEASGVFVGPAQVKVMASLKKALAAPDAVVSVAGLVGVGKTTVVNRALEAVTNKRAVARVGRMQLAADEVLELLLTEFNVSRQPNGTIQRFAAFKRLLHDWAIGGTRAFIVVEDAERIGNDALIELEALTAAESGDSAGASIVLMGQPSLAERLSLPELARLRQRTRLRQTVVPFIAAEVQGYLKHCIRAVGGDFDGIFDPVAIDMLYRCSEGVPRVLNNLCESVLAAAAEAGASLVMPQLVQHVASEEFGLQPTLPPGSRSRAVRRPAAEADAPQARPATSPKARVEVKPPETAPAKAIIDAEPAIARTVTTEFEPIPVVPFTPEPAVARPVVVEATATAPMVVDAHKPAITVTPAKVPDIAKPAIAVTPPKAPEAAKPASAVTPPKLPVEPKPTIAVPPAMPATTAKPAMATTPSFAADSVKPANAPIAVAEPDLLPLEHIPELIQDTQPELVALRSNADLPDLTDLVLPARSNGSAKVTPKAKAASEPSLPTLDDIPTLSGDLRIDVRAKAAQSKPRQPNSASPKAEPAKPVPVELGQAKSANTRVVDVAPPAKMKEESKGDTTITEIPAWDRDPTLAELKPDIEALEAALAVVPEPAAKPEAKSNPKPAQTPVGPVLKAKTAPHNFDLPEIILEKELQVKEIEAQELLRKSGPPDTHEPERDVGLKRKHGFDLDRLAAELGKARSLEDVDDKLAETLFGEEMAQAAAEVAAMVAADTAAKNPPAKDPALAAKPALSTPAAAKPPVNAPSAPAAAPRASPEKANGKVPAKGPQMPALPAAAKSAAASPSTPAAKTAGTTRPMPPVRGPAVEITLASHPDPVPAAPAESPRKSPSVTPDSIEEQFGTSMTATLKALSAAQMNTMDEPEIVEPDEKEKPSRRLFGLFRGSS